MTGDGGSDATRGCVTWHRSAGGTAGEVLVVVPSSPDAMAMAELGRRLQETLMARAVTGVLCDVSTLTDPSLVVVDRLLRLQLVARRHGHDLKLINPPAALRSVLAFSGLEAAFRRS